MPTLICPKCRSTNVKLVTVWHAATGLNVTAPPRPMFACQKISCLHKWERPPDAEMTRLQSKWKSEGNLACAHRSQRLFDLSLSDAGQVMVLFFCVACGKEFVRPHETYHPSTT
jgi:hypothetical protein